MSKVTHNAFWVIENTVTNGGPYFLRSSVEDYERFYMWVQDLAKANRFGSQSEAEKHATMLIFGTGWFATQFVALEGSDDPDPRRVAVV